MDSIDLSLRSANACIEPASQTYANSTIGPDRIVTTQLGIKPHQADLDLDRKSVEAYREQLKSAMVPIAEELVLVEQMLRRELHNAQPSIAEMLTYVSELGGKRLRPCLVLLAAKAAGRATDESIRLSVVVELVHTATLVHDDILDEALLRRHRETVHQRWNIPASVLIGDWLFTHAYGLANRGTSTIPGRWIADAAKQVCEGEILQGNSIRHFELEIRDYLKLLEAKTGALCAVSCSLGAWSAGADESICFRMQQYGLKMGTAFQVYDDWLDVWGQQDNAGKTLGTDLASFKPTLPAIRTLGLMPADRRAGMILRLNQGDLAAVRELRLAMDQCDASDFTCNFAKSLISEAINFLTGIPTNAASVALRNLALAAVNRQG